MALLSVARLMGLGVALDISRGVSDGGASCACRSSPIAAAALTASDVRVTLIVAAVAALAEALPRRSGRHPMHAGGAGDDVHSRGGVPLFSHAGRHAQLLRLAVGQPADGGVCDQLQRDCGGIIRLRLAAGVRCHLGGTSLAARCGPRLARSRVMAAAVVVALSEIVHRRAGRCSHRCSFRWHSPGLPISAATSRRWAHNRRLDVVRSTDHGVCVVDDHGVVRTCNAVFAALVERRATRSLTAHSSRSLPDAAKSDCR